MIKILFFIEELRGGGAEKVLCNLVNAMDQSKFDVTVQTLWKADAEKYLKPWIRYRWCYCGRSRINRYRSRAEAALGLTYPLHIRDNYDIEVAYLEMGPTKIMASSTNRKAIKLAWVHCDLMRAVSDSRAYVQKTAPWYAKFDQVVCVSQSVKKSFDELFKNRFASAVLYNVVDDAAIRADSMQPLPAGMKKRGLTVLSAGRFSGPKNFIRLLRTHKRLLGEGVRHDLWLLGDGPERPALEAYLAKNGLQDTVRMPGYVDNPYPYMREADLLACSSNYEGYSTFMTEGIILGRPVVTTEVSGMRELLGDSAYGLITANDDEAFYQGMKRVLTDDVLRLRYAAEAAARGQEFSAGKRAAEAEQFFKELAQS